MISSRIPSDWDSSEWALAAEAFRRTQSGIDLTISSPMRAGMQLDSNDVKMLLNNWQIDKWQPDCRGSQSVRELLAQYETRKGIESTADDFLLVPGTSDAFALLFKVFTENQEGVLVPKPGYPLLEVLASLEGIQCVPYALHFDHLQWKIDRESLLSAPNNSKALLVVSPNNPTGSIPSLQEWEWITEYCHSRHMALLVDEVFADYHFESAMHPPWRDMAKRIPIARLGGLSKSVGTPQVKLAWIWFDAPLIWRDELWRAMEYVADAFLGVSSLAETIAPALLQQGEVFRNSLQERLLINKECLKLQLKKASITMPILQGGWYACFQIPNIDDEAYCIQAMKRGVLAQPGFFFDFAEENWIVVSLLASPNDFSEGLNRLLQI